MSNIFHPDNFLLSIVIPTASVSLNNELEIKTHSDNNSLLTDAAELFRRSDAYSYCRHYWQLINCRVLDSGRNIDRLSCRVSTAFPTSNTHVVDSTYRSQIRLLKDSFGSHI